MAITPKVNALLSIYGKKKCDLMELLNMGSRQALSAKFVNERWSAEDIVKIAEFCGCKLAFVLPDGQQIFIDA